MKTLKSKATPLTPQDQDLLAEHELIISQGIKSFILVGQSLLEIRDKKLYRGDHKTFEDYLKRRWNISRAEGYRQIEAAQTVESLSPNRRQKIQNPCQARAMAMVPQHLREKVIEMLDNSGEIPTEQSVTKAVNNLLESNRREIKEREEAGQASDESETEADEEAAMAETGDNETPVEKTLRRVAKKVEKERMYLARGLEHLRLALKDLRKVDLCDMETQEGRQAARELLDAADAVFSRVRGFLWEAA